MLERIAVLGEIIVMGIKSIFANKMRSALTTLGIFIGVTTIISMISVIEGMNKSFEEQLQSMGSSIIFVSKFEPGVNMGRMPAEMRNREDLKFDDAKAVDNLPSIKAASPITSYWPNVKISYRNNTLRQSGTSIVGVSHRFLMVWNIGFSSGRFFTEGEENSGAKVCIIGFDVAESLFPNIYPIGKKILVGNRKYTVIGVFEEEEKSKIFGESGFSNDIVIPYSTLMRYYPYRKNIQITAYPKNPEYLEKAEQDIIEIMRIRRKVKPNEENNFSVFTQETIGQLYNQITGAAFMVMILIAGISLLVGGIGVMNIMIVTVKERTREIGIRKALGAKRKHILWQFLVESISLTFTGGGVGLFVGWLISFIINKATPLPATITTLAVVAGLSMAIFTGLFFGIFPAMKAAKLNPIEALRYE